MFRARYRRILFFFGKVLLSLILWEIIFPRLGLRGWSQRTRPERLRRIAAQFRILAIRMGGVLIKVGQFLSSRVDVLPREITDELVGLQDEVPPERYEDIRRVAEAEYGMPLKDKFEELDPHPLAAASLGQVHRAKLYSEDCLQDSVCESVVVKIQRPNIETIIATDLAALRTVGFWLKRYQPISKRVDVPALLAEFTRVLYEEIDYITEGHNAETFAAIFTDNPGVRVPGVVWTHTTKRALTLEDVGAIKITDYDAITVAKIDRAVVAKRLFNVYLKQIFEDGFFHADPHPGNLFVTPIEQSSDGDQPYEVDWQLTFVDFGMVGRLPNKLREGLRELVIGVGLQDAGRVVKSYQLLGVLLPNADLTLLEKAGAKMFEMFWGRNMSELQDVSLDEMHEFAEEFRDLMYSMPFQIPQDIIFLVRCVGILSGMCTGLDPDFNLWEGLAPFAQKLITEEASSARETILEVLSTMARRLLAMPGRVDAILMKVERGELAVHDPHLSRQLLLLERTIRRGVGAIIFAVLLIGGIQLFLAHYPFFGILLMVGAALSLLWILFTGRWR